MAIEDYSGIMVKHRRDSFIRPRYSLDIMEELQSEAAGVEKLLLNIECFIDMDSDEEFEEFLKELSKNRYLKEVTLGYLKRIIYDSDDDTRYFEDDELERLLLAIAAIPTIEIFHVSDVLDSKEIVALSKVISQSKNIKETKFCCSIKDSTLINESLCQLAGAIQGCSSLQKAEINFEDPLFADPSVTNDDSSCDGTIEDRILISDLFEAFALSGVKNLKISQSTRCDAIRLVKSDAVHALFQSLFLEELEVDGVTVIESTEHENDDKVTPSQLKSSKLKKVSIGSKVKGSQNEVGGWKIFARSLENSNSSLEHIETDWGSPHQGSLTIAQALQSNKSLKRVRFSADQSEEELIQQVALSEYSISSLETYDVRIQLEFSQRTIEQFMSMIERSRTLKSLSFDCSTFSGDAIRALGITLSKNPRLEYLDLRSVYYSTGPFARHYHDGMTDADLEAFFSSLETNRNLKDLNISGNHISQSCIDRLVESLQSGFALEVLTFVGVEFHGYVVPSMEGLFLRSSSLQKISMGGGCSVGQEYGAADRWNVSYWPSIADNIREMTNLVELDIQGTDIGDEACIAIAESLSRNTTLEILDLSYNMISNPGALAMATMLSTNRTLQTLDLENNDIFDDNVISQFSRSLLHNSTLKYLKLAKMNRNSSDERQPLTSPQCSDLLKMLEVNTTLLDLTVDNFYGNDYEFDELLSYYIRLNHLGRNKIRRMLSEGGGRQEWVEALIDAKNDLDCCLYLLKLNPSGICDIFNGLVDASTGGGTDQTSNNNHPMKRRRLGKDSS